MGSLVWLWISGDLFRSKLLTKSLSLIFLGNADLTGETNGGSCLASIGVSCLGSDSTSDSSWLVLDLVVSNRWSIRALVRSVGDGPENRRMEILNFWMFWILSPEFLQACKWEFSVPARHLTLGVNETQLCFYHHLILAHLMSSNHKDQHYNVITKVAVSAGFFSQQNTEHLELNR